MIIPIYAYGSAETPTPVIDSVSPPFAPEEGGTVHTVIGTGFIVSSVVHVDGSPVYTAYVSATQVAFTAPTGTFGIVDLLVDNGGGKDSGSSGDGLFGFYAHKDLEALNDGTYSSGAFSAATGMTIVRADTSPTSNVTLRTSASVVIAGIGANVARVFNDGTNRGLLIEQRQHNYAPHARNIQSWAVTGQGTQTNFLATGPDGTQNASWMNMGAGQTCNYFDLGLDTATRSTFSCFQRSANGGLVDGDMQPSYIDAGNVNKTVALRLASLTWGFLEIIKGSALRHYVLPVDTFDCSGFGGQTSRARNIYIDLMMLELGDFSTSCILGGSSVVRDNDYVKWPSMPTTGSRMRLFMRFAPMYSSTSQVPYVSGGGLDLFESAWTLWESGANNYMYIKDSDKKLYCKLVSGSEIASTWPVSFTQWDEVRFLITLGNGGGTFLKYSVNGGAWTDLVMADLGGSATPPTDMTFLASPVNNTTSRSLPSLLRELRSYPVDITEADV